MKLKLLLLPVSLLLSCTTLFAASTLEPSSKNSHYSGHLEHTADYLLKEVINTGLYNLKSVNVRVSLYYSPKPNALTQSDGSIMLSTGLLDSIESYDELAFILAHELAHLSSNQEDESEEQADLTALEALNLLGFDQQAAVSLLRRVCQGNSYTLLVHSGVLKRIEKLEFILASS